jgi:hypothetical protein
MPNKTATKPEPSEIHPEHEALDLAEVALKWEIGFRVSEGVFDNESLKHVQQLRKARERIRQMLGYPALT